jgi:pyruvate dehydrogenase E2 component (dihydrolipoamide acetyltransferase)
MRYEFHFPDIGEGLAEGKIIELKASPGDRLSQGDPIAVVETDKVVTDIPSPRDGILLEVSIREGQVVKVGEVIAVIEVEAEAAQQNGSTEAAAPGGPSPAGSISVVGKMDTGRESFLPPSTETKKGRPAIQGAAGTAHEKVLASPVARKLASATGVDLTEVRGSGPAGRILVRDVTDAASRASPPAAQGPGAAAAPVKPAGPQPLSTHRLTIAANMEKSQAIPSALIQDSVEVDSLVSVRADLNADAEPRVSYLAFILRAAAIALAEHPLFNASFDPQAMTYEVHGGYPIGVAVDVGEGLVVPVVRDAGKLSVLAIQKEIDRLAGKARSRALAVSDLRGGTFTITNYGAFAGTYGRPLILPPQVGILGTGRIHQEPVVRNGAVVPSWVLPLSLVFDHRLIDGVYASRFLLRFMGLVSKPLTLLAG